MTAIPSDDLIGARDATARLIASLDATDPRGPPRTCAVDLRLGDCSDPRQMEDG